MRRLRGLLAVLAAATLALLLVLTLVQGHHREAGAAYTLLVGSLASATLARVVREAAPPRARSLFERTPPAPRPVSLPELEQLRLRVASAQTSAHEFHHRLRPRLYEVVELRLARHGIDAGRHPEIARARVGDDAWELLRPDRPAPSDIRERGVSLAELRSLIEAVESL